MKCDICGKDIGKIFLGKIIGTHIKVNGKQKNVCSECQSNFSTKKELLEKLQ
ncbi:hypothetical protein JXM83_03390 [Candidatus Woesearchaeota archaeon]|nr:hypothetical protein [Candidatus Woesearchaeota archaeon]